MSQHIIIITKASLFFEIAKITNTVAKIIGYLPTLKCDSTVPLHHYLSLTIASQDADMADDDSGELASSTSIPTTTSVTTVGATPTATGAMPTTALGDKEEEEEEEPKPKPGKKRAASSAKKIKKEAEGSNGETADGGEQACKYGKYV